MTNTNSDNKSGTNDGKYTPLGVWIANWSDLFPWLSTVALNSIESISEAEDLLRFRTVIQDFDTLRKIYYIAHDGGLIVEGKVDFLSIADSFSKQMTKLTKSKKFSIEEVDEAISNLSSNASKIYHKWAVDLGGMLRKCELGLGVVVNDKNQFFSPIFDEVSAPFFDRVNPDGKTNTQKLKDFSAYATPCKELEDQSNLGDLKDYSFFADTVKCMPLILPGSGEIYLIRQKDPIGILCSAPMTDSIIDIGTKTKVVLIFSAISFTTLHSVSHDDLSIVSFSKDKDKDILLCDAFSITAVPIPFSAAEGIREWKGRSVSTNVGSFQDLHDQLDHFSDLLKNRKTYTFSSENWSSDHKGSEHYSLRKLRTQYVGIVPEGGNIFTNTDKID